MWYSEHRSDSCNALNLHCVLCEEGGRKAGHRLGSAQCGAINNLGKNRSLPRIRKEELDAKNARNNIYKRREEIREQLNNGDNPDRKPPNMDIDDVIS